MSDSINFRDAGYNFTTILKRLEAATSRLEDLVESGHEPLPNLHRPSRDHNAQTHNISFGSYASQNGGTSSPAIAAVKENASPSVTPRQGGSSSSTDSDLNSPSIAAYDEFCSKHLNEYIQLSKKLGGLVEQQSKHVEKAFKLLRGILVVAMKAKKPDYESPEFFEFLKPIQSELLSTTNIRDENRTAPEFNQLSTVMSGISVLGWVTIEPAPVSFMSEMKDSSQFYANRVLKDFKGKDELQVSWVRSYLTLLASNKMNLQAIQLPEQVACLLLPPPPPPSNEFWKDKEEPKEEGKTDMGAVFAEINKGENITSGLRKVDKSEMTHKNPDLRKTGPTPGPKPKMPSSDAKQEAATPANSTKAPRIELENTKWFVENQVNNHSIVLEGVELKHTVQILDCSNCTLIIKGKLNAVSLSNCKRTSVVVDTLVAAFEVTKCSNFGCQVMDYVPMIVVDQCDGGAVYLSKNSLSTEITTSKSSGLNVNVPVDDGDYAERAIPEQVKHRINEKGELVSEIVRHE
ncbi:adenylyl cyclase-associated protein Cap1 [Schizosaccharomyces cryophilus OY26]|uniref:Adenylyl cyclase-associated protein n=1 Tax=Schizosaccharomyces cryophilus (strain OY26 / ATCC MYA-4695 / CBS 11777 / NBRC 106824 / NRRL Y48691) TaxID=653667 RepID=S9X876_SCHCR|nr:adenylyl cyclase-associated protein Cap1 [Schizosaccharomyces cryophilus OY26]EPY49991.1 adenylyl cyclase-associated protein Cap1 [Schizosaccharomyces cryophilus OY26]